MIVLSKTKDARDESRGGSKRLPALLMSDMKVCLACGMRGWNVMEQVVGSFRKRTKTRIGSKKP